MRFLALSLPLLAVVLVGSAGAAPLQGEADDDAVVVVNGDVTVGIDEESHGVFILDGNARIHGQVEGDVVVVVGDAIVSGRIGGDLVTLAGRAHLLPNARLSGALIYGDEDPRIPPPAKVAGEVEKEEWSDAF